MLLTEALQKVETVKKRIEKKRRFVKDYCARFKYMVDPFGKQGGAEKEIAKALQGIEDLEQYIITIRKAIQKANDETMVTVGTTTRSISDWLIWKREVAQGSHSFTRTLIQDVQQKRASSEQKIKSAGDNDVEKDSWNLIVHLDERKLHEQEEEMVEILGSLDAQLSIKNATVEVFATDPEGEEGE